MINIERSKLYTILHNTTNAPVYIVLADIVDTYIRGLAVYTGTGKYNLLDPALPDEDIVVNKEGAFIVDATSKDWSIRPSNQEELQFFMTRYKTSSLASTHYISKHFFKGNYGWSYNDLLIKDIPNTILSIIEDKYDAIRKVIQSN